MGISTVQSYRGAQIFEAIGLSEEVDRQIFHQHRQPDQRRRPGRDRRRSRSSGIAAAFRRSRSNGEVLDNGGQYQWRRDGEYHMWNPDTVAKLQHAVRVDIVQDVQGIHASCVNDEARHRCTLRGLLQFKKGQRRRFRSSKSSRPRKSSSASSPARCRFGSISTEAHENLAIAMNRIGGKTNTGEGGEDPRAIQARSPNGDLAARSAIKQVAIGAIRRDHRISRQRRRTADQDGPGRQARRRRAAARPQGR